MRRPLVTLLAIGALACALPEDPGPSEPDPLPESPGAVAPAPPAGGSGPVLGSPSTAPAPEPTPETDPGAPPDTATPPPPDASGCGEPYPPDLSRIGINIHQRGPNSWTLDATPLVGPAAEYCAEIGFTDGRSICPVRPEGHPERVACETLMVGIAVDTGRPGPTWRRDGAMCTGAASGCANDGENQYLLKAIGSGLYTACARNGLCGDREVNR